MRMMSFIDVQILYSLEICERSLGIFFIATHTYIKWTYFHSSVFYTSMRCKYSICIYQLENKLFWNRIKPPCAVCFVRWMITPGWPTFLRMTGEGKEVAETSWSGKWYQATWSVGSSPGIFSGKFMIPLTSYKSSKFERWPENSGNAKPFFSTIL